MRKYIKNLTDHIINKNRYRLLLDKMSHGPNLVNHIQLDLESGDVAKMSPGTLGKIMCSFEVCDVMAGRDELFDNVSFGGDCEGLLRKLVARSLAFAIRDRLVNEFHYSDEKPIFRQLRDRHIGDSCSGR